LTLTPDNYKVPQEIKSYHAGFKHIKEITMPKIMNLYHENKIDGFFIAEGDLYIDNDFNYKTFLENNYKYPTWLCYKKITKNYIVGNFLLYFPKEYILEFNKLLQNQKRLIYSDRFFTKLVKTNWLKIVDKSKGNELEHYSNVIGKVRKGIKLID
jgi:hypothetical protein